MIHIYINKETKKIEIKGHAGYGPHGKDIICAAVSAVSQSIAFQNKMAIVKMEGNTGYFSYEVVKENKHDKMLFEVMAKALEMLASENSEYIKIEHNNNKIELQNE